jgi:hypothetical protein
MSDRNPNRILLDGADINAAFDVWYENERKHRNFGVNRDEQRAFKQGLIAANAIIHSRIERKKKNDA